MTVIESEVAERLARIETKVDMLLGGEKKTDRRLSAVEQKQWYHSGALALGGFILYKLGLPIKWL